MNRLLRRATKRMSVSGAASLLIGISLIGQILGFLRIKLINANFPAVGPQSTDAFFAAFKIPDFFFLTIAAGALGVAFIPYLSDKLENNDRKGAWRLSSSLLNIMMIVMGFIALAIIIFAKPLIQHVAPGINGEQLNNAVMIMRLISLNPLFFTISGVLMSIQQTIGRFFFYAIAPLFYNLCIIISAIVFSTVAPHDGGPGHLGIVGLGVGAAVGAFIQLLIAFLGMWGTKFRYETMIRWENKALRGVLRQLPARSIDQGIDAINSIVETRFARKLGEGNISYYENAYVIHTTPILLIGTAISTAAFPRMTERLSQGRPDLFRREFLKVLKAMIWISMPILIVTYFARGYLARIIFTRDSQQIALILGFLCGAMFFRTIYQILSRYFYAHKDTVTPLIISLITIGLNIYLAFTLARPGVYNVAGLALAQTLSAMIEVIILLVIIIKRDRKLFSLKYAGDLMRILSVTGFAIVGTFVMISLFPLEANDTGVITLGTKLTAISAVTFSIYITMSALFNIEEVKPVTERIKKLILKPINIDW